MGQVPRRTNIASISNGLPCEVVTVEEHDYPMHSFVRLTNLNGMMPSPHGQDELNNNRYRIVVTGLTSFTLQYPITFDPVDSTLFPPYTTGGYCNLIATEFVYLNDGDNDG